MPLILYGMTAGKTRTPEGAVRRVSFSELLGGAHRWKAQWLRSKTAPVYPASYCHPHPFAGSSATAEASALEGRHKVTAIARFKPKVPTITAMKLSGREKGSPAVTMMNCRTANRPGNASQIASHRGKPRSEETPHAASKSPTP